MTLVEVAIEAKKLGLTYGEYVRKYNPSGGPAKKPNKKAGAIKIVCAYCGNVFVTDNKKRKYCSKNCKNAMCYKKSLLRK